MAIPATGLFRVYFQTAAIFSGNYAVTGGAPPPITTADVIAAYYAAEASVPANAPRLWNGENTGPGFAPFVGVYEIQSLPKTRVVFDQLGTPTPINFTDAAFPVGVRFNQISIWITGLLDFKGFLRRISLFQFLNRGAVVYSIVPGADAAFLQSPQIVGVFNFWGPNQLFGAVTNWQATVVADADVGIAPANLRTDEFYIQGVYNTAWINLSLGTPNANPGDQITIDDSMGNMNIFTKFKAYWKPNRTSTDFSGGVTVPIITQSPTSVTLRLPTNKGLPYGGRRIAIYGVPSAQSLITGEIPLAQINATPLLTDGSGIYNLTPDKTNDTYYDRSASPIVTVNRKIPDPFIRTGSLK